MNDTRHFSHKELFWGINPGELPSFQDLLAIDTFGCGPHDDLPDPQRSRVIKNLMPIYRVCRHRGYYPLMSELALIADPRMLEATTRPYFVSYIACFLKTNTSVKEAYENAMEFMKTGAAGHEQIVPHRQLYGAEHAVITMHCDEVSDTDPSRSAAAGFKKSGKPNRVAAHCLEFEQGKSDRQILDQVSLFVRTFLKNVSCYPEVGLLFRRSVFFLVPFVRPFGDPYSPNVGSVAAARRGVPAGSLFLFLAKKKKAESEKELGRSLSWLLAAATLRESMSALDLTLAKRELLGSMLHGTFHAIRSVRASMLCNALSRKTPPDSPDDLEFRLFKKHSFDEDRTRARILTSALKVAMLGEDTAAALLAFGEMNLSGGVVRRKFCNGLPEKLSQLCEDALVMVNPWPEQENSENYVRVEIDLKQTGPVGYRKGAWIIPTGYLEAKLIRGLFSELIRNASLHGKRDGNRCVKVSASLSQVRAPGNGLVCRFVNDISEEDDVDHVRYTSRFLLSTQKVLRGLGLLLDFRLSEDKTKFIASLELGPLQVEGKHGELENVCPVWQEDSEEEV